MSTPMHLGISLLSDHACSSSPRVRGWRRSKIEIGSIRQLIRSLERGRRKAPKSSWRVAISPAPSLGRSSPASIFILPKSFVFSLYDNKLFRLSSDPLRGKSAIFASDPVAKLFRHGCQPRFRLNESGRKSHIVRIALWKCSARRRYGKANRWPCTGPASSFAACNAGPTQMKIDPANLRVINPYLGGGFGGKRLRTRRNHRCGDRGAAWRTLQAGGRGDMVTPAIPNLPDFSLASRLC
jgi:hypothetical protein